MFKKAAIILVFIVLFALALWAMFYMQKKTEMVSKDQNFSLEAPVSEVSKTEDEPFYVYKADSLNESCALDDKIFCAVERVVKCTINPDLSVCDKDLVPGFVLGQNEEVERPTEISFKIVKIKPIPESSDISVYTKSDCNALWFGLCKGTVVYLLATDELDWFVTNIYALE